MKKILIVAGIVVVTLSVLIALRIVDIKALWAALTLIVVGGGSSISASLRKEVEKEQQQIREDGAQKIEEIKSRPVDQDIQTLSSDTQTTVEDVKTTTTQNILKRIKQRGQERT